MDSRVFTSLCGSAIPTTSTDASMYPVRVLFMVTEAFSRFAKPVTVTVPSTLLTRAAEVAVKVS